MKETKQPTIVLSEEEREYIKRRFPKLPDDVETWSRRFDVDDEDIKRIANAPQGTEEWLGHRRYRMTGSNYGTAVGENPYETPMDLVRGMIWNPPMSKRGVAACAWGSKHEDWACQAYETYMRWKKRKDGDLTDFHVEHFGLEVHREEPWSGDSKDGLICNTLPDGTVEHGLLEIKCPTKRWDGTHKIYESIPSYYYSQIQGIMGYNKLPWCDFVVWTPYEMKVSRYYFDQQYYDWLRATMRRWYVCEFAPRAILKDHGRLKPMDIDPVEEILVNDDLLAGVFADAAAERSKAVEKSKNDGEDDAPVSKLPAGIGAFFRKKAATTSSSPAAQDKGGIGAFFVKKDTAAVSAQKEEEEEGEPVSKLPAGIGAFVRTASSNNGPAKKRQRTTMELGIAAFMKKR